MWYIFKKNDLSFGARSLSPNLALPLARVCTMMSSLRPPLHCGAWLDIRWYCYPHQACGRDRQTSGTSARGVCRSPRRSWSGTTWALGRWSSTRSWTCAARTCSTGSSATWRHAGVPSSKSPVVHGLPPKRIKHDPEFRNSTRANVLPWYLLSTASPDSKFLAN